MKRFAVLASGTGTNFEALLRASKEGFIPAELCVLVTDREGAGAIRIAQQAGVPVKVVQYADYPTRDDFSEAVARACLEYGAEFVCMAGFMRILSKPMLEAFPNLVLNTHPSLLPAFPGVDAVRQALEYGVKVTGCTVHIIDEEVDHGPIIAQEAVPVLEGDTEEVLHARIKSVEHRLYPEVARSVALGKIEVVGRKVIVRE